MSERTNPSTNHYRHRQGGPRCKHILHVSLQGHDHALPPYMDGFELRQLFSGYESKIKGAIIFSSPQLEKAGKVTFISDSASIAAQKYLHGSKLADGSSLNVRFWRKEDDEKHLSMTPGASLPPLLDSEGFQVVEDPNLRTVYVRINDRLPNNQVLTKQNLCLHFDLFKNDIERVDVLSNDNGDFAFVKFKTRKIASEAISCLNNSLLCGRRLLVAFKRIKKNATSAIPSKEPISGGSKQRNSMPTLSGEVKSTHVNAAPSMPSKVPISGASRSQSLSGPNNPVSTTQSRIVKKFKGDTVMGYAQIVLGSFYEPICTSSEISDCKKSLLDRCGTTAVCSCETISRTSVVSQVSLRTSKDHVVTIRIVVGSLITERADAVVIPTERAAANAQYTYPIAVERPWLLVDSTGSTGKFSRNLCNYSAELFEIGETSVLRADDHHSSSHIIQVLYPLCEQKSSNNLSCDESVRNSLAHATQNRFGSIAFPGIKSQMVNSLITCLSSIDSTTLHTVSIVLRTESEAKMYSTALNDLIQSSSVNKSGNSEMVAQDPLSATASAQPAPSSSTEIVWSWKENDGSFIPYTPAQTKALDAAYQQDSDSTYFTTIGGTKYSINFKTMKQTNLATRNQREIRRRITNSNERDNVTWKYMGDYGCFTSYSPSIAAQIESMFQNKDESTYVVINKRTYRFDFTAMKQINVMTGYERGIRYEIETVNAENSRTKKPVFLCNGEVIVNIHGPLTTLAAARKKLETKLKDLLFSKTIPYPSGSNESLLSKIQDVAKRQRVSCTVGEGGESGASNVTKQVLTIQGLQTFVEKAQTEIQELMLAFHASFDTLPKSDKSSTSQYPPEWVPMSAQEQVKFHKLPRTASEFSRVNRRFQETMDKNNYIVVQIEQVQNKHLWTRYQQSKVRLHSKDPLTVNEKELFHGTRDKPASMICSSEEGFDMRFSREGMWGQANYFAVNANYSDTYSYHDASKQTNEMILAKVLTGDSFASSPDQHLRMPPVKNQVQTGAGQLQQVRYDSVNGVTHGSRVFMTYSNDLAYPAFIITYTGSTRAYQPPPSVSRPTAAYRQPPKPPQPQPKPKSQQQNCTIS